MSEKAKDDIDPWATIDYKMPFRVAVEMLIDNAVGLAGKPEDRTPAAEAQMQEAVEVVRQHLTTDEKKEPDTTTKRIEIMDLTVQEVIDGAKLLIRALREKGGEGA